MPRFRPRISLLTALLLMTIAGMAILIVQLWREVGPLRGEVRRLRDEVGRLSIEDNSKIHAIEVRTTDPLVWRFRVWVPEGQKVRVSSRWGDVPRIGNPEARAGVALGPGEQWITYRVMHSSIEDMWFARLESSTQVSGETIREGDRWWQWPRPAAVWGEGVQHTTGTFDDDQRTFVLKRWRVADTNYADDFKAMEMSAGFMIWLERQ